jgi:hypothetical protein
MFNTLAEDTATISTFGSLDCGGGRCSGEVGSGLEG